MRTFEKIAFDMLRAALLAGMLTRGAALRAPAVSRRRRLVQMCAAAVDTAAPPPPFATLFESALTHGRVVSVRLPSEVEPELSTAPLPIDELHPRELERMDGMKPLRRATFAGGRVAMRRALGLLGSEAAEVAAAEPVLPDGSGAPTLAAGHVGSISHTHGLAAALTGVAPPGSSGEGGGEAGGRRAVGLDVELASRPMPLKLARRVLAPEERESLGDAVGLEAEADLLLRFSIKEALYKALHPLLRQPILWHSVRILPAEDGSCAVDLGGLEEHFGLEAGELVAEASWQRRGGYFISSAAASHEGALVGSALGVGEAPLEKGVVRPTARGGVPA